MEFCHIFGSFQRGSITVGRMDINWPSLLIICNGWQTYSLAFQVSDRRVGYILNKSEKRYTWFVCHLYAKWRKPVNQMKVYLNMQRLGYAYSKSLRILSRGNTRKSFKCDRGPIFLVTNLNRNLTQFMPSEIHCLPDSTERNGSLRHLTTRNVFWSFRKATLESGVFIKLAKLEILSLKSP